MKLNKENGMKWVFFLAALTSVLAVALICIFLFAGGVPAMAKIGFGEFLFGQKWKPANDLYGIFPMIMGSICVTGVALLIGVPIAIFTSVFMAAYCPKKIYPLCQAAINLMSGVPSVVYGFFGLVLIVPTMNTLTGRDGSTMLTASILLAIMVLPTIVGVAETAIRSVPDHYYEGSLALGATKEKSMFFVVLPAAKSGVIAGIVLGIGRVIGETMAVIMVAGNQARMPAGLFKGVRTLTANIVLEMGYAADLHREALIATGVVLFVFILIINLVVTILNRRAGDEQ
ncbi:MAG: phosphate ABC transporter permease subunit PstC [Clostridia bacterium]|nr:phosphate ABC transporter permease subunit PstC [Lachnospiraceae bacterium]NCC01507.1 phosphate ABC transporter permease subunit PstC [Clostridia bacterium]NCD03352.1 phosphate ABC transporter permease subunit PstC [Clostridia bacterium]